MAGDAMTRAFTQEELFNSGLNMLRQQISVALLLLERGKRAEVEQTLSGALESLDSIKDMCRLEAA
jgi:hypothetical protein